MLVFAWERFYDGSDWQCFQFLSELLRDEMQCEIHAIVYVFVVFSMGLYVWAFDDTHPVKQLVLLFYDAEHYSHWYVQPNSWDNRYVLKSEEVKSMKQVGFDGVGHTAICNEILPAPWNGLSNTLLI